MIGLEPPDEDELIDAIYKLKNNKITGTDDIPAELIKSGGNGLFKTQQSRLLLPSGLKKLNQIRLEEQYSIELL